MDNPLTPAPDAARWAPPLALVVLGWLGAVAAAGWCALTADPAGRVLAAATVLVLGAAALFGTRARPRLAADRSGLAVRGLGAPVRFDWPGVRRVRLVHLRRFGRRVPTLEIEAGAPGDPDERLLVFGWLDLGTDPAAVADTLARLRAGG